MHELKKYKLNSVQVEAIQYNGSSTHKHAIKQWLMGEEYRHSSVWTADYFPMFYGQWTIQPGDYVVRYPNGIVDVFVADAFESKFSEVLEDDAV